MVKAWLINFMEDHVGQSYLYYSTAKELWDALNRAYSDVENAAQMFELRNRARNLKQGDQDVTTYYTQLSKVWNELDLSSETNWSCTDDTTKYRKLVEKERIYDFLAGLNKDLDDVRGRLLGIKPFLSIDEIFAEVRQEEYRRRVMLGDSQNLVTLEGSALTTGNFDRNNRGNNHNNRKGDLWCDHCQKSNHNKENCWRIHGKPAGWKDSRSNRKNSRGYQAANPEVSQPRNTESSSSVSLSKEQVEQLLKMLSPSANNSFVAQKGIFKAALNSALDNSKSWIVDSGASDHMTSCANLFSSYEPSPFNFKVRIADGSLSTVAGSGTIKVNSMIILKSVLHVPKLSCNLISVSKLSKDLNCTARFSHSDCIFQDLTSAKKIGSAEIHDGLYYFVNDNAVSRQDLTVDGEQDSVKRAEEIILWHRRLGHPSFPYLKNLFLLCSRIMKTFIVMFVNYQSTIVPNFLLNPIKRLNLFL